MGRFSRPVGKHQKISKRVYNCEVFFITTSLTFRCANLALFLDVDLIQEFTAQERTGDFQDWVIFHLVFSANSFLKAYTHNFVSPVKSMIRNARELLKWFSISSIFKLKSAPRLVLQIESGANQAVPVSIYTPREKLSKNFNQVGGF